MSHSHGSASGSCKTFAEFFAGVGLVREGLAESGWRCVYANDLDPKKKEIYDANFPGAGKFDLRDVWDVDGVLERLSPAPLLATASFPCVDLSLAGHFRGFDGAHSSTFFAFAEVLRRCDPRPPLLLVENVVGFLTARGGRDFTRAATTLAELGYRLDAFVLNASAFTPQSRPRVFLIGVHEDVQSSQLIPQAAGGNGDGAWLDTIARDAAIRPPALISAMRRTPLATGWIATPITPPEPAGRQLAEVIDLDDEQAWWNEREVDRHYAMLNDRHRARIDAMLAGGGRFIGAGFRRRREDATRLEVRFDGLAGCLRTPRGGSARQIVVAADEGVLKMRWMSAVEYARLQGAGRFTMLPNERQMLFGFGDAVCVPVISWIDQCVLTPLHNEIRQSWETTGHKPTESRIA
jgi:DNA (cytosine-5)-methyltransferase 1